MVRDFALRVLFLAALAAPAAAQVVNGSFETGDLSGWTLDDLDLPLNSASVAQLGEIGYFGALGEPTDGDYQFFHGFDGDGPDTITLSQVLTIPAGAPMLLLDFRAQWNLLDFGATQDRTFSVGLASEGQDDLPAFEVLRAVAGSTSNENLSRVAALDFSDWAGQELELLLEWSVPEDYTGPAQFELDHLRFAGRKPDASRAASLRTSLDFDQEGGDTLALDLVVNAPEDFLPEGATIALDVGGVLAEFELDAKGVAADETGSVKVSALEDLPLYRRVRLNLVSGDFLADLEEHGLEDTDTPPAGLVAQVPVSVDLDGTTTDTEVPVTWKAKEGQSGKARGQRGPEAFDPGLVLNLNFAADGKDVLVLGTSVLVGPGFLPEGEDVLVEVGGLSAGFLLDAKGDASADGLTLRLRRDPRNPLRQTLKLQGSQGDFAALLAGLIEPDADTPAGGVVLDVPVHVTVAGQVTTTVLAVTYKAKAGKSGKAKG